MDNKQDILQPTIYWSQDYNEIYLSLKHITEQINVKINNNKHLYIDYLDDNKQIYMTDILLHDNINAFIVDNNKSVIILKKQISKLWEKLASDSELKYNFILDIEKSSEIIKKYINSDIKLCSEYTDLFDEQISQIHYTK